MVSSTLTNSSPRCLSMPQELCDMIAERLANPRDALVLRLVCRTFAIGFAHHIGRIYDLEGRGWSKFEDHDFVLFVDNEGIKDIEALARSFLMPRVRYITLADRAIVQHHLKPTSQRQRKQQPASMSKELGDSHESYRCSSGVWAKPGNRMTGSAPVIIREGDCGRAGIDDLLKLRFYKLDNDNDITDEGSQTMDFTRCGSWIRDTMLFDIEASDSSLERLAQCLPKFVNLESIRTKDYDVVVVDQPRFMPGTNVREERYSEAARKLPCLPLLAQSFSKRVDIPVVWPVLHDLGKLHIRAPNTSSQLLSLKALDLTVYNNGLYSRHLSSYDYTRSLADFVVGCPNLESLAFKPTSHPTIEFAYAWPKSSRKGGPYVEDEIHHLIACLLAAKPMPKLKQLTLHHVEANRPDIVDFLQHQEAKLEQVVFLDCRASSSISRWIALLVAIADMAKVKEVHIDTIRSQNYHYPFDEAMPTLPTRLLARCTNLATESLGLLRQLRALDHGLEDPNAAEDQDDYMILD